MKILVLCTGNTCRSQMAHGFFKTYAKNWTVQSAGTFPEKTVNPLAVKVMKEKGIDISSHRPQNVKEFVNQTWDYVITVCDDAEKNCPVFGGKVKYRIHQGFEDPSKAEGSADFVISEFRRIRDEIENFVKEFVLKY